MARGKALVAGATGMVGTRIVERLLDQAWQVVGLCRHPPEARGGPTYLELDIADAEACRSRLAAIGDATHLFYAARAPHAETGIEPVEDNLAMVRNLVEATASASTMLRHVHLVHGSKYYGMHLGAYKTPARETDPRHPPPNFYYDQQDYVAARAGPWTWTISRPGIVIDFAPGRARNLIPLIGTYAAVMRALDRPLTFPGRAKAFSALTECVAASHLGEAIVWMATTERCANQPFNVTNGDCYRWQNLWPRIADLFAMPTAAPGDLVLADLMADKAPVWDRLVREHDLHPTPYDHMALWSYGDFVFAPDYDILSDTTKIRQQGFHATIDTEAMYLDLLGRYRTARLIP